MNILILSWRDPRHPLAGGAEQSVLEHAKGWLDAGNNITWFSSRYKNSFKKENFESIEIERGGNQYLGVQFAAFFHYLKNKNKIDLVIDQFHGLPFFTPLYVRKPKLALIQEVAKKVWFLNPLPRPINWLVGLIGYLFEPLVLKLYRNVFFMTASMSAREDIIKMGIDTEKITVIPHGVTLPKKAVKSEKEKIKTITYLGILSKDKGIEDAIKCFQILASRTNYQFWVIGQGETKTYEEKIKKLAKSLGNKIIFWGFVSQQRKFELLAKSHILINPSIHEGWGLVNIEANCVGTPVVACNSAGLVDSVRNGESGAIVENNTPEELAKAVVSILDDERNYNALIRGSTMWADKFSWSESKQKSLDLVNRIIKNEI